MTEKRMEIDIYLKEKRQNWRRDDKRPELQGLRSLEGDWMVADLGEIASLNSCEVGQAFQSPPASPCQEAGGLICILRTQISKYGTGTSILALVTNTNSQSLPQTY